MNETLARPLGSADDDRSSPAAPAGESLAYRTGRAIRLVLRPQRWSARRLTMVLLLALAAIFTIALARGWALANQVPKWWVSAGVMDESSAATRAEGVERGVTAALYSHRPDAQEWTVELRSEDANAWMRERLPRWLANRGERWPAGISPPRIQLGDGEITLGVSLREPNDSHERIVSITFQPQITASGALLATGVRAHIGRAPLPGVGGAGSAWASWLPDDWTRGETGQWLAGALAGSRPLLEETVIALEDGRAVSLQALAVEQGRLRLTCVSRAGFASNGQTPTTGSD